MGEGGTQCYRTMVLAIVVLRAPAFRASSVAARERCVQDRRSRRHTFFQSRGIDQRLEGRSRLADRLGRTIELTFHKIVAPNHGENMPTTHVHSQQCTLHQRLLIQGQNREFPCWVDLGHAHLNHIATPEQLSTDVSTEGWIYVPDPGMP